MVQKGAADLLEGRIGTIAVPDYRDQCTSLSLVVLIGDNDTHLPSPETSDGKYASLFSKNSAWSYVFAS